MNGNGIPSRRRRFCSCQWSFIRWSCSKNKEACALARSSINPTQLACRRPRGNLMPYTCLRQVCTSGSSYLWARLRRHPGISWKISRSEPTSMGDPQLHPRHCTFSHYGSGTSTGSNRKSQHSLSEPQWIHLLAAKGITFNENPCVCECHLNMFPTV